MENVLKDKIEIIALASSGGEKEIAMLFGSSGLNLLRADVVLGRLTDIELILANRRIDAKTVTLDIRDIESVMEQLDIRSLVELIVAN